MRLAIGVAPGNCSSGHNLYRRRTKNCIAAAERLPNHYGGGYDNLTGKTWLKGVLI